MILAFNTYLQNKLKAKLPGKKAHLEAAPYRRIDFSEKEISNAKKSAVLVLFYLKKKEIYTVLIQRSTYNGKHSGQISFPGGKVEKFDTSIYNTALREAYEEIGVNKNSIEIIGQLSDVFIPVSNFHVVPVLGVTPLEPQFILEPREVENVVELGINELLSLELAEHKIMLNNNTTIKAPTFQFQNKIVWGATALMLNELKYLIEDWN